MKKVKLGEILSLKKGKKATVLAEQTTLSQRYIQIDDLRNNNNLKFTESLNMTEALPDDILIAWDGANAGTVGYGLSGAVGSTITVLKKNERYKEKIISDYLGVFLESKSQYLRDHSTGATIPHLNKNILLDLQLELLGIEEQENIICILNTIKRLITKRKLQLDELNLLVKSRFNEMFILNDFSLKRLGELVEGVRYGTSLPATLNGKYGYLRMNNITEGGQLNIQNLKHIDIPEEDLEKYVVRKGDVLFNRTNSLELVGKTCIYELDYDMVIAGYIIRIRTKNNILNPRYLSEFLNFPSTKKFLRNIAKGAVNQANINAKELQNISIPLPPLALQNEFADFVAQVDKSQLAIQKSLEELETLKKSLMQEYFG